MYISIPWVDLFQNILSSNIFKGLQSGRVEKELNEISHPVLYCLETLPLGGRLGKWALGMFYTSAQLGL